MQDCGKINQTVLTTLQNFEPILQLSEHAKDVTYVDWSPDDTRLVSCSQDKTAKLWNITV